MELCGEVVRHKVFGSGQIIEFTSNYVTVLFDENKASKKFIYPSAFGDFLELENTSFLDRIEDDKNELAKKAAENKRISDELMKLEIPRKSKEVATKRRRTAAKIPD